MKTFLTHLFLLLIFVFTSNAESGYRNGKNSLPDISNPNSVTAYMKGFLHNSKSKSLNSLYAMTDKRIVSSISETRDELDGEYGDWYIESKSELTFNDAGLLTEIYEYMRNEETSELELFLKVELTYNESGDMSTQTIYFFMQEMAQFMEFMKGEIEYNADGTMHQMMMKQFDFMSMEWFDYEKTTYEYTDGNLTHENNFTADEETGELINDFYTEYFYNVSGFIEQSYDYILSDETGEFMPSAEMLYTTDATGRVMEIIEYFWNSENEDWDASENIIIDYDSNGNPTEELFKWNDFNTSEFYDNNKYEYFYADENYNEYFMPIKQYFNPLYTEYIVNVPTGYLEYWFNGEDWTSQYKTTYQYANGLSSVTENINNNFRLYPNPASEILYFATDEMFVSSQIEIFSLTGTKLISTELSNSKEINVSNLTAGLYIYNIELDGKQFTGKIIIQ